METQVKELFSTHIYAAPEVLFEILCQLEDENQKHFLPDVNNRYSFASFNHEGKYELMVCSYDSLPPEKIYRNVALAKKCEINIIVYDEEFTKTVKKATFKPGITIEG